MGTARWRRRAASTKRPVSTPTTADYTAADPNEVRTVELMVGDLQRLRIYADLGFQIPVDVPKQVWAAYERLTALGFDRYVIT